MPLLESMSDAIAGLTVNLSTNMADILRFQQLAQMTPLHVTIVQSVSHTFLSQRDRLNSKTSIMKSNLSLLGLSLSLWSVSVSANASCAVEAYTEFADAACIGDYLGTAFANATTNPNVVSTCLDITEETAECFVATYVDLTGDGFCSFFAYTRQGCAGAADRAIDCAEGATAFNGFYQSVQVSCGGP
jgi:hypothetical protein